MYVTGIEATDGLEFSHVAEGLRAQLSEGCAGSSLGDLEVRLFMVSG